MTRIAHTSEQRCQSLEKLQREDESDVAIIGGGVNGACLYDTLCRQKNYKVLLQRVVCRRFSSGRSIRCETLADLAERQGVGAKTAFGQRHLTAAGHRQERRGARAIIWRAHENG